MSQRVPPLDLQPPSKPFIGAPGTAPRPFVVDNTRRWPTPDASWPSTSLVGQPDGLKRRRTGPAPAGGMGPTPPPAPVQGGAPPPRSLESSRCRFAGAPPRGKPPLPERHLRRMKPRSFWERRPSPACTAAAGRGWSRGTPRPLRPCRNVPSRVAPSPPPFPVGPLLSLSHPSARRLAGSRCARRLARRRRRPPPPAPPSGNRAAAVATHAAGRPAPPPPPRGPLPRPPTPPPLLDQPACACGRQRRSTRQSGSSRRPDPRCAQRRGQPRGRPSRPWRAGQRATPPQPDQQRGAHSGVLCQPAVGGCRLATWGGGGGGDPTPPPPPRHATLCAGARQPRLWRGGGAGVAEHARGRAGGGGGPTRGWLAWPRWPRRRGRIKRGDRPLRDDRHLPAAPQTPGSPPASTRAATATESPGCHPAAA